MCDTCQTETLQAYNTASTLFLVLKTKNRENVECTLCLMSIKYNTRNLLFLFIISECQKCYDVIPYVVTPNDVLYPMYLAQTVIRMPFGV